MSLVDGTQPRDFIEAQAFSVQSGTFWKYEGKALQFWRWCKLVNLPFSQISLQFYLVQHCTFSTAALLCTALAHPSIISLFGDLEVKSNRHFKAICEGLKLAHVPAPKTMISPNIFLSKILLSTPLSRTPVKWLALLQYFLLLRAGHVIKLSLHSIDQQALQVRLPPFKKRKNSEIVSTTTGASKLCAEVFQFFKNSKSKGTLFQITKQVYKTEMFKLLGTSRLHGIRRLAASVLWFYYGVQLLPFLQQALQHKDPQITRSYILPIPLQDQPLLLTYSHLFLGD